MNFFEMCKTGHFEEILSKIREGIDVILRMKTADASYVCCLV